MAGIIPTVTICRRMGSTIARVGGVGGLRLVAIKSAYPNDPTNWSCKYLSGTSAQSPRPGIAKPTPYATGPEGQTAPENFDGGDYDEEKNEEYEQAAEQITRYIRRVKKILSSALFVGVLGYVGYSRRGKRAEVAKNIEHTKFLKDDQGLFKGSERIFCEYTDPKTNGAKVILPASIVKDGTIKKIQNLEIKESDIIVASFPKAGTTWAQEIVYLINNDLNFEEAKKQVLETRFPYLEYPLPGLSTIEKTSSPRLIKTHLPFELLPSSADKAKVVYVTRNPKDTVVSYFHFTRMFTMFNFVGTFDDFLEKFQQDQLPYCPFFRHIESYAERKESPNMLIVSYEELSMDPTETIQKIATFLGKTLSDEDVKKLVEHTRFHNMAKNASVNYEHWDDIGFRNKNEAKFMRKGKVGDWRNYLSKEENEKFDEWIKSANKQQYQFMFEAQKNPGK